MYHRTVLELTPYKIPQLLVHVLFVRSMICLLINSAVKTASLRTHSWRLGSGSQTNTYIDQQAGAFTIFLLIEILSDDYIMFKSNTT